MRVDGDLALVHGFEQGRLRFRSGAVDLVGQQDVGEHRSALEFEFLLDGGVDRDAQHVRGQHVAGELDALKAAVDGAGERLAERGLADSRDAFDQQMAFGENGNQGEAEDVVLAADDAAQTRFKFAGASGGCDQRFRGHWSRFYYGDGGGGGYRCHRGVLSSRFSVLSKNKSKLTPRDSLLRR